MPYPPLYALPLANIPLGSPAHRLIYLTPTFGTIAGVLAILAHVTTVFTHCFAPVLVPLHCTLWYNFNSLLLLASLILHVESNTWK